jgi:hypothetical protein
VSLRRVEFYKGNKKGIFSTVVCVAKPLDSNKKQTILPPAEQKNTYPSSTAIHPSPQTIPSSLLPNYTNPSFIPTTSSPPHLQLQHYPYPHPRHPAYPLIRKPNHHTKQPYTTPHPVSNPTRNKITQTSKSRNKSVDCLASNMQQKGGFVRCGISGD